MDDRAILWELLSDAYQPIVLADKGYIGDAFAKELKDEKGITLLALKRNNSKNPYPKDLRNWISKHRNNVFTACRTISYQ